MLALLEKPPRNHFPGSGWKFFVLNGSVLGSITFTLTPFPIDKKRPRTQLKAKTKAAAAKNLVFTTAQRAAQS